MLQGSLENFALDEVLGLLSGTSKTGRLEVSGNRGSGTLSFHEGRLTEGSASATVNGTEIDDVMFELLRFDQGTFSFSNHEVEPFDDSQDVAAVLATAESRLQDWRAIEAVVPSLGHHVSPIIDLPTEEVTVTRDEWAVLAVIAAGCPVSEVCDRLKLGEVEGSRRVMNLVERSLIIIAEPVGNLDAVAPSNGGSIRSDNELVGAGLASISQSGSSDVPGTGFASSTGNGDTDGGYQVLGSDDATSVEGTLGSMELSGWESDDSLFAAPELGESGIAAPDDFVSGPALGSLMSEQPADRPPMPPTPSSSELLADPVLDGDVPPGLVSPVGLATDETSEFDESAALEGAEEAAPAPKGSLLSRYLSSDD